MAQWTLKYTTVEDPSNYITVIGNIGHSHGNVPWDGMNDNEIPNLYNVNITGLKNTYDNGAITFTSVSSGDTGYILPFRSMFGKLYYLDEFSDTSNMTNAYRLFYNCNNLITIPNFNTSNVKGSLREMFSDCYNLTNISNFDTSNVTSMEIMFGDCHNLINIPDLNTSNVINMSQMFFNCYNLINITISLSKNAAR